jgi:uncharacterized protein YgiB involved in biofilm formation
MTTRRSKSIRLALMGSIGLVGVLPGCDEPPQADAFATVEACIQKTGQDQSCREGFAEAQAQAQSTAPAFRTREACEAVFNNCGVPDATARINPDQVAAGSELAQQAGAATPPASASSGGSWFMPLAAGYLLGRATSGMGGAPYFQRRDGGAVGFQGRQPMPIDPRAFGDQAQRERQQALYGGSGGGGSSSSSRGSGSRSTSYYQPSPSSRSGSVAGTGTSRSGGFGSSARASGGSSSGG